jgi:predicted secreted protein
MSLVSDKKSTLRAFVNPVRQVSNNVTHEDKVDKTDDVKVQEVVVADDKEPSSKFSLPANRTGRWGGQ